MVTRGHCFCKKTTWEYSGENSTAYYCHCDDCRRNCSSPVVAWLGVPTQNFRWTGDSPKTLESSPGVYRHFCSHCGSPMGFEADHYKGMMSLYAASMEDSQGFKPSFHVYYESKLPWFEMNDNLVKYQGSLRDTPEDLSD